MLTYGFFEMENIRSFDYTPSPIMKAVMANFSSGISTFSEALLWVLLYGQQVITWLPVRPSSDEVGDECDGELFER